MSNCCGTPSKPQNTGCGCSSTKPQPPAKPSCSRGTEPCAGPKYQDIPYTGYIETPAGKIPVIPTAWTRKDYIGAIKVRSDMNRMDYALEPGLYAVGDPDAASPVLVSANYKLSFDMLRAELAGLNVWILVIDSKGVNVWCAAGKGTFGTGELINRIRLTKLAEVVNGRRIIVPQLGAPGISAHRVEAACGFHVVYGPVRAKDIKAFLAAGMKADAAMRRVTFGAVDRLIVAWLEFVVAFRHAVIISAVILAINTLLGPGASLAGGWHSSRLLIGILWSAVLSGTILTALFLPYLPGRAFSVKGGVTGALTSTLIVWLAGVPLGYGIAAATILGATAVSAYLAFNYTGATTFTSLSGVKKELRYALPAIIGGLVFSGIIWTVAEVLR